LTSILFEHPPVLVSRCAGYAPSERALREASTEDHSPASGRRPEIVHVGGRAAFAGVTNEAGNVVGLMPHPEHAVDPLCGPSTHGLGFFSSARSAVLTR